MSKEKKYLKILKKIRAISDSLGVPIKIHYRPIIWRMSWIL